MAASAWLIVVLIIVLTNKQLLYNAFPASKIIYDHFSGQK